MLIEKKDGFNVYKVYDETFDLAWLSDSSFLLSTDTQNRGWFKERIAKKNPLTSNKEKMSTLERADKRSGIWFAALQAKGSKDIADMVGTLPIKNGNGIYGTISLQDGLTVSGGVVFDDEAVATSVTQESQKSVKEFSEAAPLFGTYTKNLTLSQAKEEMRFTYAMSKEELEGVANMAKQQVMNQQGTVEQQ